MPLPRLTYLIELESQPDVVHTVEIRPADQMVAEQAGLRFGLGPMKQAPMTYTHVWMWAAMRRLGLYDGEWPSFQADVIAAEPTQETSAGLKDPEEMPTLDPTTAGPSTASP